MKTVHITIKGGDTYAACGHKLDYMTRRMREHGWAIASHVGSYYGDPVQEWKWCRECVDAPDYALYLLATAGE